MHTRYAANPDVDAYIRGVVGGSIPACRWVKLCVERHVHDLEASEDPSFPFVFDEDAAQLVLDFYRLCIHVEGELAGEPFEPLRWQKFVDWVCFGWKHRETGTRRFRESWVEVSRGNGKSFWAACTGLYLELGDAEPGAKVYSAATKEDQAAIVWSSAAEIGKASPGLADDLEVFDSVNNRRIYLRGTKTTVFLPIAADHRTMDGLNPHGVINDEVHEHRNRKLYQKLKTAMGKRRQPMMRHITTAGDDDTETLYDELRAHAEEVLEGWEHGDLVDDEFFAIIYAIDEGDDWKDEGLWTKANPSLGAHGASVRIEHLRAMAARAEREPGIKRDFLRMHCGRRVTAIVKAIPPDAWDACRNHPDGQVIDWEDFVGQDCVLAADLSSTQDLTAVAAIFPRGEQFYYRFACFLPRELLKTKIRDDNVPYDEWARDGYLTLTPGNQIDELAVAQTIEDWCRTYNVLQVTHDPWHAVQLANTLARETGMEMVGYRQDLKSFGAAVMHFLDEVFTGRLRHDGNPLVRWCSGNVVTKEDADGNRRFHKKASRKRIDPLTAAAMARGRLLVLRPEGGSMYDNYDTEGEEGPPPQPPFGGHSMYDDYGS